MRPMHLPVLSFTAGVSLMEEVAVDILMVGKPTVDDHFACVVDEDDLAGLFDGCQSFGEDPCMVEGGLHHHPSSESFSDR